jgi:hypothetical protein
MESAASESHAPPVAEVIDLKDPASAAVLAWLVPGLGHWYQGRRAKAVLFFFCILGPFLYGVYLGGDREMGFGRAVYFSWRDGDRRLAYLAQIGIGVAAMPALVQANRMANHQAVWWNGFMAPPRLPMRELQQDPNSGQPTLSDLNKHLHHFFELGTVFTLVAGLMNVLAIYDAFAGPAPAVVKKEDKPKAGDEAGEAKAVA